jgi:hypothetical protein
MVSSVWKPLRGPIHDWPLAICDAESVDKEDVTPADVVSLEQAIENMVVHYNPKQQWYYLSNQEPNELLIFRQADSENRQGQVPSSHSKAKALSKFLFQASHTPPFQTPTRLPPVQFFVRVLK